MFTNTMIANGYAFKSSPPKRWYKFMGDVLQPFGLLQVGEGLGLSKVDPGRRAAVKFLPARGSGTSGGCDDFEDLYEDVNAGGTLVFTIVCDASNNITDFSWTRHTGTRLLSAAEVLLVEATEKLDQLDTHLRQSVPPNLAEQLAEIHTLLRIVVARSHMESAYPEAIPEGEAVDEEIVQNHSKKTG